MTLPLTSGTIAIVKATVPAMAEHGIAIAAAMVARLFRDDRVGGLFHQAGQGGSEAQIHTLAAALLSYAQNIDNLGALASVVERIVYKHVGYRIMPEHYACVANALLSAMEEVLADAATEEILAAWSEAYWFLADILKSREAILRDEMVAGDGGWHGWRRLSLAEKIRENSRATPAIALSPRRHAPIACPQ